MQTYRNRKTLTRKSSCMGKNHSQDVKNIGIVYYLRNNHYIQLWNQIYFRYNAFFVNRPKTFFINKKVWDVSCIQNWVFGNENFYNESVTLQHFVTKLCYQKTTSMQFSFFKLRHVIYSFSLWIWLWCLISE